MLRLRTASTFVLLCVPAIAQATGAAEPPDARRIHWQRTLADARALAAATGRPLLLALNMDGESASDRIVREQYRDPRFVALTRKCVCVGASVFRHNARDHDDHGRRICCPRFAGITCGEHVALEPIVFERYLADGERIAPRHALVRADGTKAFDISLAFDMKDVDRALAAAVADVAPLEVAATAGLDWAALAARRDAHGRDALEAAVAAIDDAATLAAALAAIAAHGDAGSADALRLVVMRSGPVPRDSADALAAALRVVPPADAFAAVQRRLQRLAPLPSDPGPELGDVELAHRLWPRELDASQRAVAAAFAALDQHVEPRSRMPDPPGVDLHALLQAASAVTRAEPSPPRAGVPAATLRPVDELERHLAQLDEAPAERRATAAWQAELAQASLELGRHRAAEAQQGAALLFEDAARYFERATAAAPDHYEWWIERARVAFHRERFDEQIECARRALALALGSPGAASPHDAQLLANPLLQNARAIEALRWLGDAHARSVGARAGADAAADRTGMVEALRALGTVAVSPFGRDADWITLGSLCGAFGLQRQHVAIAWHGAVRFPASRDLRAALNAALWQAGRPELMPVLAAALEHDRAPTADGAWFAGYASILAAEDARRQEAFAAAGDAYLRASTWFHRARTRNPDYADDCARHLAIVAVGDAFARVQAGDRRGAAAGLARAIGLHRDLAQLRDGLGNDVLDLVDKIVEWRATGPSEVTPIALLDQLDAVVADEPFWAAAVADAALREALRADGKNPDKRERTTVDAAGEPITMPMGLPTAEGDGYLAQSIAAGRRAAARAATEADKLPLAQSLTIAAERELERGRTDGVQPLLADAAAQLGLDAPPADAGEAVLRALTAQLRARLGEARPRFRPGR